MNEEQQRTHARTFFYSFTIALYLALPYFLSLCLLFNFFFFFVIHVSVCPIVLLFSQYFVNSLTHLSARSSFRNVFIHTKSVRFSHTPLIFVLSCFVLPCKATAKIQDLQFKITNAEEEVRSLQLKHEFELEVEKRAKKCLQQEKDSLENELNISKQEVMALKSTVAKMTADSLGITTELQATKVG